MCMIDSDNYCFCMGCELSCQEAGNGCGRCLERKKEEMLKVGIEQAKKGLGKPLDFNLEDDNEWLDKDEHR